MKRLNKYIHPVVTALSIATMLLVTGCVWDESDNEEVSQKSNLPDTVKTAFGADPNKLDTDGDGLTDDFEISHGYPFLKPDNIDTNANGVTDADEDSDQDKLTNKQEQQYNTHPLTADTDGDGLSDYAEIFTYKTDPLKPDTDSDGVSDGREVTNGTNPLIGDSTLTITSKKEFLVLNTSNGVIDRVNVEILGVGDLAGKASIKRRTSNTLPFEMGVGFDISLPPDLKGKMQSASITIPYDPTTAGAFNDTDFAILTIDPATGFYEPLATVANSGAKTLTATTTHFSDFFGIIKSKYDAWLATLPKSCTPVDDPNAQIADVVLVIDSSGSMFDNDPQNLRRTAAKEFIKAMKPSDRTAVVDFDGSSRVAISLSQNQSAIGAAIDTIDSSGSTNIGAGISSALNILTTSSDNTKLRAVFLLTDGDGSYNSTLTTQAASAGIKVFTVGLTGAVNDTLLSSIATGTGGAYKKIANANSLIGLFNEFSQVFGDTGKDTDGDGLTDCQETYGVLVPLLGRFVTSDPQKPDTDGDNIPDGDEIGAIRLVSLPFSSIKVVVGNGGSDPNMLDTDSDSVSDQEEYAEETKAYLPDSDGDGLLDSEELRNGTSPIDEDTDGDSMIDSQDTNPLVYEAIVTKTQYISQFAIGYICPGEFEVCTNTFAKAAGKIANAFTPFVGNIFDVLSAVANTIRGDYVSAGVDVVGIAGTAGYVLLTPVGGAVADTTANIAKAGKVIAAFGAKSDEATLLSKKVASSVPADLADDVVSAVNPAAFTAMKNAGMSDETIATLAKSGKVSFDTLKLALEGAKKPITTGAGFLSDWREAENVVRAGNPKYGKAVDVPGGTKRYPDDFNESTRVAKEAKNGCEDSSRVVKQIEKDAALKSAGVYSSIEWHFFASAVSGCIGPGAKVLSALANSGIPYIMHLP